MTSLLKRFRLDGKLVLVTGASSGIGAHIAKVLASVGARVNVASRRGNEALARELSAEMGTEVKSFTLDVTSPTSVQQLFDDMKECPDVIINNAGVAVTKEILKQTVDDYDHVLDTNLKGSWMVATEAARRMVAAKKGGNIVNIASISGLRQASGVNPYAISKAGVLQLTKNMALELARYNIRVNALCPGYVITDLNREYLEGEPGQKMLKRIPTRQFLQLEDLDGPLLLLASEAGKSMTGSLLTVDGGHLVSSL